MLNIIKQTVIFVLIATAFLHISTMTALAEDPKPPVPTEFAVNDYLKLQGQKDLKEIGGIGAYIVRLMNFMAMTIGSFAFLAIVVGGFMMVTSAGQEAQVQRGKDIIKLSIIGLIVVLMAYFLVSFTQSIFYEYGA
jgi:hypothetical protein